MKTWKILAAAALGAAIAGSAFAQQTTLRIFTGGQQRPDVMRKIADEYQKKNPNVKVEVEVGMRLPVALHLDRFHLFDADTGQAIRSAGA